MKLLALCLLISSFSFAKEGCLVRGEKRGLHFSFQATTNMPGVTVEGHLKVPLDFTLQQNSELVIPLINLTTEMQVRDEHMIKDVFQQKNPVVTVKDMQCDQLSLSLTLANVTKDVSLRVSQKDKSWTGILNISLESFKIKAPEKFGVRVEDLILVKLQLKQK